MSRLCCGFGAALTSLVDAFSTAPALAAPRFLLFLGSRPNYAMGALPPPDRSHRRRDSPAREADEEGGNAHGHEEEGEEGYLSLLESYETYDRLAHDVACIGAACFLFTFSAEALGLSALQSLASRTGGILNYYTDVEDSTMPEDIYKQLCRPFASEGLLRVRTSAELAVSHAYGPVTADPTLEQLYHLPGCHEETQSAFSLEFSTSQGFSEDHEAFPTIQVAYSYTTFVPVRRRRRRHGGDSGDDGEFDDADGGADVDTDAPDSDTGGPGETGDAREVTGPIRWVRVRRLRIQTTQLRLAKSPRHLYESVQDRETMTLLTHKVISAIEKDGFREGRLLLQDWLIVFLAKYQSQYGAHPESLFHRDQMCPSIADVPRWVYGLLRGPLLSSHTPLSAHRLSADLRTWVYTLYRSLPMPDLCVAIRPALSAYRTADHCEAKGLALTQEMIDRSSCSLFLLDAYTHLFVYATDPSLRGAAPPSEALEWPPSKTSSLWQEVTRLKSGRLRTPRVVVCRQGSVEAGGFESYIDSKATNEDEVHSDNKFSFAAFLHFVHAEMRKVRGNGY